MVALQGNQTAGELHYIIVNSSQELGHSPKICPYRLSPVSTICHLVNPLGLGSKNAQGQIHGQLGQPERPSASSSQLVADTVWISRVCKLSMVNISCPI